MADTVRPMEVRDLAAVLSWRNHPEVRGYMLTQHEIHPDEHRAWFAQASADPARRLLIVEGGEVPLGFVHFTGVAAGGIADWGFYAAPDAPKGLGRRLGAAAMDYAFGALGLWKVCGQALDFNTASARLHLALGFKQEGILRDQCLLGGEYHDLVCFGLLASEWPGQPGSSQ